MGTLGEISKIVHEDISGGIPREIPEGIFNWKSLGNFWKNIRRNVKEISGKFPTEFLKKNFGGAFG